MRESIRKDRARIQLGRISNFGLLEMTRQRLREGSIKWETQLSLVSFSQKILKKIQLLAFTEKVKKIKSYIPQKVKSYIELNLNEELDYFQKKYSFKIDLISDEKLIIPDYKIELLNKSKKVIKNVENFSFDREINFKLKGKTNLMGSSKEKTKKDIKKLRKTKKEVKKNKGAKKPRTLWVRRKKN